MKKAVTIFTIIASMIITMATLVGCSKSNNSYEGASSLVIGIQHTQNCAMPNINDSRTIMKAVETTTSFDGSQVSIFEVDGRAYEVENISIEYEFGLSASNKRQLASDYAYEAILSIQQDCIPLTEEVDTLYGLTAMANKLQTSENENKHLVLITNLLSTSGLLNFCEATIYFDIDNYLLYLKDELPNLKGIDVTFFVVETDFPQTPLQNSDIARLKDFYNKLCTEAGARTVEFFEDNSKDGEFAGNNDIPAVSCVDVRQTEYEYTGSRDNIDVCLEESTLFLPDSTEFLDETITENELKKLVDPINSSTYKTLIFGSTATTDGSREGHLSFAYKRADTIRSKLVELGANERKLECYSLGMETHPYRVNDAGPFATDQNREKNRCVFIVSENLEKANHLKTIAMNYEINR